MTAGGPRFLVTGATGFLGRHVLEAIRAERPDARITVLVRSSRSWEEQPWAGETGEVDVVVGGLLDSTWAGDPRLDGLTGIFHLAAEVKHTRSDVDAMMRTNVEGITNMVRLGARRHARVLFASTSGTVGASPDPGYAPDENAPLCEDVVRDWPYYASKVRAEQAARAVAGELGADLVIVRPPILLGPGDHRFRSTSNVLRLLRGRLPVLFDASIHFVDIRDVARAMVRAMLLPHPRPIYHFPGTVCALDEFFRMVARAAGITPRWRRIPIRPLWMLSRFLDRIRLRPHVIPDPVLMEMGMYHWGLSSRFSHEELGFAPRDPEETIRDTVQWLRANHPALSVNPSPADR
jgi:dihydroflavonol-4-reductase